MRTVTLLMLLLLVAAQSALADGSVDWVHDALPILKKNPALLKIIEDSLEVERVGWGVRVGHDASGNATLPERGIGARMPPFKFSARPKGSTGPYTLWLIIHDPETGLGEPGETGVRLEIRQKT